jgi:hypothetical protein
MKTPGGEERFVFRGGIIFTANTPMAQLPELRALATRITVMRLDVSEMEIEALMRDLARKGSHSARNGGRLTLIDGRLRRQDHDLSPFPTKAGKSVAIAPSGWYVQQPE